ncbi:hypothetical protein Cha6605_2698 [Chamaesiphon minutus PCC 6605]|uniref:Uncharacterized protein n=1 Tax=Chamaesiphon minutus (strain ATCC 27169 / PCC 6605) TaxID=1173020 RepID=K9UG02_CHAP6|nr:hypothetical protein Cha6605_2698 [Chamaesiphon minutus PCC 6605]
MLQKSRQLISSFLIVVLITVSLLLSSPANASANIIPFDLNTATDIAKNLLSNGDSIKNLLSSKQAIYAFSKLNGAMGLETPASDAKSASLTE